MTEAPPPGGKDEQARVSRAAPQRAAEPSRAGDRIAARCDRAALSSSAGSAGSLCLSPSVSQCASHFVLSFLVTRAACNRFECTDDSSFALQNRLPCEMWVGRNCWIAHEVLGYSAAEEAPEPLAPAPPAAPAAPPGGIARCSARRLTRDARPRRRRRRRRSRRHPRRPPTAGRRRRSRWAPSRLPPSGWGRRSRCCAAAAAAVACGRSLARTRGRGRRRR